MHLSIYIVCTCRRIRYLFPIEDGSKVEWQVAKGDVAVLRNSKEFMDRFMRRCLFLSKTFSRVTASCADINFPFFLAKGLYLLPVLLCLSLGIVPVYNAQPLGGGGMWSKERRFHCLRYVVHLKQQRAWALRCSQSGLLSSLVVFIYQRRVASLVGRLDALGRSLSKGWFGVVVHLISVVMCWCRACFCIECW